MKIVFLDAKTIGDDIDLSGFEKFSVCIHSYKYVDVYLVSFYHLQ